MNEAITPRMRAHLADLQEIANHGDGKINEVFWTPVVFVDRRSAEVLARRGFLRRAFQGERGITYTLTEAGREAG